MSAKDRLGKVEIDQSPVGIGLLMGFADTKKIEQQQP